jgi:AraC-like DNA-binding protein
MQREIYPETILCTSDYIGVPGFRVLVRQLPADGEFGSGRTGASTFALGYRPVEERGRTIFRFRQDWEHPVRMARVSAVLPPNEPFEAAHTDAAGKIASFQIQAGFLKDVVRRARILPGKLQQLPPAHFVINQRVDLLCSLLMHETEAGAPSGKIYFENLAAALLIAVLSQTDVRLANAGNLYVQNRQVQSAVAYIEENFRSKLTLAELARVANLSPFHFDRLFSRVVGLTPHAYILDRRLRFAQRLLSDADFNGTVADIASDAGFADQSHFARCFRRAYGKSPQAYRSEQECPGIEQEHSSRD